MVSMMEQNYIDCPKLSGRPLAGLQPFQGLQFHLCITAMCLILQATVLITLLKCGHSGLYTLAPFYFSIDSIAKNTMFTSSVSYVCSIFVCSSKSPTMRSRKFASDLFNGFVTTKSEFLLIHKYSQSEHS